MAALKKKKKIAKVKKSTKTKPRKITRARSAAKKNKATKKVARKKVSALRTKVVARAKIVAKTKPAAAGVSAKKTGPTLQKFVGNPIIVPQPQQPWSSRAAFNPAALYLSGKIHLVYRAIGDTDQSTFGYASTLDGLHINEEYPGAIYPVEAVRETNPIAASRIGLPVNYASGGGTAGGCEDPRLVAIGDWIYAIYTAFDGWSSLRLAMTSIKRHDFLHKKWNWRRPVLISPPGEINKNWVLFPEKVKGRFALLHSIFKGIEIEYFDDPNTRFDGTSFVKGSTRYGSLERGRWDSQVRGAGPPPIKTEKGWLLLYHAIDHRDPGRYKLGAMLLDLNDPSKITYRCSAPILSPDEAYENNGHKAGIIYSCGAVVVGGRLFVYYGGADTVVCVATAPINAFLAELMTSGKPTLAKQVITRRNV